MRKFLIAGALALSVGSLGGCATFSNPATQQQIYNLKNAYGIALAAAKNYRAACVKHVPAVYPQCRDVVPKLQAADRKVQGAIAAASAFVVNNPTISPISLIGAVETAINDFKAVEAKFGVQ